MSILGKIIAYSIAVGFILLLAFFAACVLILQDGKKVDDLDYEFTETDKIISRISTYKANGLSGNVSDLFFVDENTGIALSSFNRPDNPDSVKIFHTSDAGHNWHPILVLPKCSSAFNAIKIGNCVFFAVKRDSIYSLLSVDIPSGNHTLLNDKLTTLPILFQCDSKLGYTANGVFYTTDYGFKTTDSVGSYDIRPQNKGLAMIDSHIYGFIFDKDSCISRLYDFKDKITVGDFTTPGDVSLIKTTDRTGLILAAEGAERLAMYVFDGIEKTFTSKTTYTDQMMRPLKIENGISYTLVSAAPNTDSYLLVGDSSWQTKTIIDLNESNIKAYCLIDKVFYYYYFLHRIIRIDLNFEAL